MDKRTRAHIKALAEELKNGTTDGEVGPAQIFMSGMLTGLAGAVQIADGASAEKVLEDVSTRLAATIGELYLAGKLPAPETGDQQ